MGDHEAWGEFVFAEVLLGGDCGLGTEIRGGRKSRFRAGSHGALIKDGVRLKTSHLKHAPTKS